MEGRDLTVPGGSVGASRAAAALERSSPTSSPRPATHRPETRPLPTTRLARVRHQAGRLGRIFGPWPVVLLMATGLLPVAVAAGQSTAEGGSTTWRPAYLLGILIVVVPAAVGLALPRVRPVTPAVLSLAMAVLVQVAQVMVQPARFVRDDDVLQAVTVSDIGRSGRLFEPSQLAPDLAAFPGLAVATAGVQALTGLSVHASAMVLVVLIRFVLAGSVLLLVSHVTRSPRIGALAVVLYAANPQLLVADDLWSPGRLATAVAVFAAYLLVTRRRGARTSAAAAALALFAVAWTDQRTALAMALALVGWLLVEALLRHGRSSSVPALAALAALAVLEVAIVAVHASTVTDGAAVQDRPLTTASRPTWLDAAAASPGWVAALVTVATVLTVLGVVLGLVRSRFFVGTRVSLAVVLAGAAVLSLLLVGAGTVPAGSAIAAWAGGLVLLGAAVVPAWWFWQRRPRWWRAVLLGLAVGVLGVGGAAGVAPAQLPPGQVPVADGVRGYDPDTVAAISWMTANLPAGSRVYADATGSLLIGAAGRQTPVTELPSDSTIARDIYAENRVRYVVADRRHAAGPSPDSLRILAEGFGVNRVYDNGSVVVYDLGALDAAG